MTITYPQYDDGLHADFGATRTLPPAPKLPEISVLSLYRSLPDYDPLAEVAHVLPSGRHLPYTGYPFMMLAQLHGVDYGNVLVTAEWLKTAPSQLPYEAPDHIRHSLRRIPPDLMVDIVYLTSLPVHERGGPH